jgi:hypothetical protein
LVLLHHVLAHVPKSLLHLLSDVHGIIAWELLSSVSHVLQDELGDVFASQGDVSHTAAYHKPIAHREHVGHPVARVDHSPRQVSLAYAFILGVWAAKLGVEGQRGLHSDEEPLHVESLKHDLGHLLSVLGSVHGRLSQDEPVLLWLASQIGIDGSVPELLHGFPVLDLS